MVEVSQGGGEPGGISRDTLPHARLSLPMRARAMFGMLASAVQVVQMVTHKHAVAPSAPPTK